MEILTQSKNNNVVSLTDAELERFSILESLTQSKNNNVVSLTDAELAALYVPSIKIEVVERDEDGNKYSDMNQDAFWEALQFRAFRACTGKINVDKFKIVIRDICSYLAAHNIPVAQIADNNFKEGDNNVADSDK